MAVKPAGVGMVDVPDATVVVVLVVAVSVSVDVVVIVALCVSIRAPRQSLFEACIDLSLLVTVVVTLPVTAGAVVVVVTTVVVETVVVTAFGVVVVSGVEVTRAVVVRVRVRAYVVEGTGLIDLVPALVVQSCCEYVAAAARLLNSATKARKTINGCMMLASRHRSLARIARLRSKS